MDAYVARQPIFNKEKKIFAYELLFRDGTANYVPEIDGDVATKTLLSNTFFAIGMDAMTNGKKSFINFTENLLLNKLPLLLPKESIVVEILEDVKPTAEIIEACREIVKSGYTLALDDFEFDPKLMPLISLAHIIKFDFLLSPMEAISTYVQQLPQKKMVLLAEKVESYEEFQAALEMGFELFQGYFFCKPEIVSDKQILGSQLTMMQIMAEANKPDLSFKDIEKVLERDMGMSYQLLRYINSAFFAKMNKISSIKQALVYMGEKEIRRFVSLAAMSNLAKGKPDELIRMACIRGKFCELLGALLKKDEEDSELFTLGMFSLIDAVINQSMEIIMQKLPLSMSIIDALTKGSGDLNPFLSLARSYEKGEWENVSKYSAVLDIDDSLLPPLYLKACQWADRATRE